jgi:hypothetical protein
MSATCEECNKEVSAKVEAYSKDHFKGKILCYDCQKSARSKEDVWEYKRPQSEEDKGIVDVSEASEEKTQEDTELKTEAREVDNETIRLVTDMSPQDKKEFYAWLKQAYGVDDLEPLNIEQKREVLEQTKTAVQKRNEEKGEGAEVKQDAEVKQEEDTKQPAQQEEKKIKIDWDNIPMQVLIPKLRKALEYQTIDDDGYTVKHTSGNHSVHKTTLDSCDCSDYVHRGTSINPCTHQVRIKYSDEEIRKKLKELGADELETMRKKSEEIKKREKVVDIAVQEPIIDSDMMITGMKPQLAELGKIKIGVKGDKMVRGHLLPKKLDHFMIATLMKDDDGRLEMDDSMNEIIGEKCTSLDICLCYDDFTMNMTSSYSWFAQSKLVCMGNGQTAMRRNEDGSEEKIICNPKDCTAYKEKKCKPYGRLSVILAAANRIGGVYILRTTGWNTIRNVLSSMAFIRKEAGGVLAGLPLRMRLLPMTVTPRDVGHNVEIYAVNIEYPGTLAELKEAGAEEMERRLKLGINMKQTEDTYREAVKARMKEEAEEDAIDIAQEFGAGGEG